MNKSVPEGELADILESALEQQRRGRTITLDELVRQYPHLAHQIREVFPALQALEGIGCDAQTLAKATSSELGSCPEQLADFTIIREVGRGGMGIVYEAKQQSLGRHIALKVLSPQLANNFRFVERFRREAQAAGRLHHTNIVPVFAVGQDQGRHFYAMQFIQGNGLDVIIEELRRQRRLGDVEIPSREITLPIAVATRLLSDPQVNPGASPKPPEDTSESLKSSPSANQANRETDDESRSITALSNPTAGAHAPQALYFRNTARICQQAAEAMAYAHEQGILHRDIKPSNLMLDLHGTVWITDFGLAKEADSSDLTGSGDVLGTLRYMSPEQIAGRSSVESDVYGLGATLYELLTLEPPFSETSRPLLLEKVQRVEPRRPSQIDPRIPRDLETIVLKALEKEPRNRYRTAKELADDLARFLNDLPILARRSSQLERVWRWCRRNRGWAATISLLLVFSVIVLPILQGLHAIRLSREIQQVANLRKVEEDLRIEAQTKLAESFLREAAATRLAEKIGLRSQALKLVREATRLVVSLPLDARKKSELLRQFRNEAVAALTAWDLEQLRPLKETAPATGYQVSASMETFISVESPTDGSFTVRRVDDQSIVAWFDGGKFDAPLLSPDGQLILVRRRADMIRELWSVGAGEARFALPANTNSASFSQDGKLLASVLSNTIEIIETGTGATRHEWRPETLITGEVAFSPSADRVALVCGQAVQIWQLTAQPTSVAEIHTEETPRSAIWSPHNQLLAIELDNGKIDLRETETWTRRVLLSADRGGEIRLSFSSDGAFLSGIGWSGVLRIWNTASGKPVFEIPSIGFATFSRQDSRIAPLGLGSQIGVWRMLHPEGYKFINPPNHQATYAAHLAIHPNGRFAAVTTDGGLFLYDLDLGQVAAILPYRDGCPVFDHQGRLWLSSQYGVLRFELRETAPSQWTISDPETVLSVPSNLQLAVSADGDTFALAVGAGALIQRPGDPSPRLVGSGDTRYVAISSDGKWLAIGNHNTVGCRVFAIQTLAQQCELAEFHAGNPVSFSSDSQHLSVWTGQYRILTCNDWKDVLKQDSGRLQVAAISSDGTWFACDDGQGGIDLIDLKSRHSVLKLQVSGHERTRCVQFSPDCGRLLAISFENPQLQIWDLRELARKLDKLELGWGAMQGGPEPIVQKQPLRFNVQLGELGWATKARAAYDAGLFEQAIQAYEMCLQLRPGEEQPSNMLAWTLLVATPMELRDSRRAEEILASIASREIAKPATIHTWALALFRNGKTKESRDALHRLESNRPNWTADEYFLEALLLCDQGNTDAARQALEKAETWINQQTQLNPMEQRVYEELRSDIAGRLNP